MFRKLPQYAVEHRASIWFILIAMTCSGLLAYRSLGRLEDPEFTLKTALVITVYPGANAREVQENVTDVVERGIYRLKNVEKLRSYSKPGMSVVYVDLVQSTESSELSSCWNELRNKMKEIRRQLPPEALDPIIKDDFSEVYGITLALVAEDGVPAGDHLDAAKKFQRAFSLLDEVGRCELWGEPEEIIEISISKAKLRELNVPVASVFTTLATQNFTLSAGQMDWQGENVRLTPNGKFESVEEIANLEITGSAANYASNVALGLAEKANVPAAVQGVLGKEAQATGDLTVGNAAPSVKLSDIAEIKKVRQDPPGELCRYNGRSAIAIAVAPKANGNVLKMGEQVRAKADELMQDLPLGYELGVVAYQPDNVTASVNLFMKNLKEAVIIVAIVVMVALGWKSGLIITFSLVVTMLATMCVMKPAGIVLQRVSLAAFIIALGVLVDNAVVVGDLILVRMERGMDRREACVEGASRPAKQLLGATIVGALAFLPVYMIPINVGEYCRSLFLIVSISLLISWFIAMTQTPVFYDQFIFLKKKKGAPKPPNSSFAHKGYRRALETTLRHKTLALLVVAGLCGFVGVEFTRLEQTFFPRAQRAQFMVDCWLPEGASVHTTEREINEIEKYLREQEGVVSTASFIGGGPPRFYLMYEPQFPNSAYGQVVVNVESVQAVERLVDSVEGALKDAHPQARIRVQKFAMGQPTMHEIEARFNGPDPDVLRDLALQAEAIMRESDKIKDVDNNWRQKTLTLSPQYSQTRGRNSGLSRANLNLSLLTETSGAPAGTYSENMKNLPIKIRGASGERNDLEGSGSIPVWGLTPGSEDLSALTSRCDFVWEDAEVFRYNRELSVIIGADANRCGWNEALAEIRPKIESIELPHGYTLEWDGQERESNMATGQVLQWLPATCLVMFAILVFLFNDFRQPIIVALTMPLTMIGVVIGMTVMHKPFGFMALLGVMGLLGMQIRNGVVLMDQIDEEIAIARERNESPFAAVISASLERIRPVVVAATTVIVGMIPLLSDALFDGMATAMMFGLMFSTLLTLFVVPCLYVIFFRVKTPKRGMKSA